MKHIAPLEECVQELQRLGVRSRISSDNTFESRVWIDARDRDRFALEFKDREIKGPYHYFWFNTISHIISESASGFYGVSYRGI